MIEGLKCWIANFSALNAKDLAIPEQFHAKAIIDKVGGKYSLPPR